MAGRHGATNATEELQLLQAAQVTQLRNLPGKAAGNPPFSLSLSLATFFWGKKSMNLDPQPAQDPEIQEKKEKCLVYNS